MGDAYNKHTKQGAGTLEGNWYEERVMRELTGHGRSAVLEHVPYRDGEPVYRKPRDGTDVRLHGEPNEDLLLGTNHLYGTAKNPADGFRRQGRREQEFLNKITEEVLAEQRAKEAEEEEYRNSRYFETTVKGTYLWNEPNQPVGKRVMKTQDLRPAEAVDEVWAVEHGIRKPVPRKPKEELEAEVLGKEHAVTLYSEKLGHTNFPMTAAKGPNPFAKSSAFTQPIHQTRGVTGFQGNI
jgi:hypothetical protein